LECGLRPSEFACRALAPTTLAHPAPTKQMAWNMPGVLSYEEVESAASVNAHPYTRRMKEETDNAAEHQKGKWIFCDDCGIDIATPYPYAQSRSVEPIATSQIACVTSPRESAARPSIPRCRA